MKSLIINMTIGFFFTLISACGGGGGSDSAVTETAPDPTPFAAMTAFAATDYDGYDLPLTDESSYLVTVLGMMGTGSNAVALNDDGVISGNYFRGPGLVSGYRWQDGLLETVIENGQVTSVGATGVIVGWEDLTSGASACFSEGVTPVSLDLVAESKVYGTNSFGEMVGLIRAEEHDFPFWAEGADVLTFADDFDGYANLINDSGLIVLHENLAGGSVAPAIYENETITRLETYGGQFTFTRDVNVHGEIVGWAMSSPTVYKAVMWIDGEILDLTPSNENHCAAVGINDDSDVVIKCQDGTGGGSRAYLSSSSGALTPLEFSGATEITPNALNNHGQIAGWLTTEDREVRSFLATPR